MDTNTNELTTVDDDVDCAWEQLATTLQVLFFEPDIQAVRATYAAIAAHALPGQPVWVMAVAPPGSIKTTILQPLEQLKHAHFIDKLTPNTFLSGQIATNPNRRSPSLLKRIGSSGFMLFADFSTVLAMKYDARAALLADLRRIFDGKLTKEVGTQDPALEWAGRITVAAAVTPDIDRHHSVMQSLGERFTQIRWHRPGGDNGAEAAALCAMNQDPEFLKDTLNTDVQHLFEGLFDEPICRVTISDRYQKEIAAVCEFVVRARTYVPRDTSQHKNIVYMPEPEAPTRLAQQLCQLARGSARLSRRDIVMGDPDVALVRRVAFDCIPGIRWRILNSLVRRTTTPEIPASTRTYAFQDLRLVGLVSKSNQLSVLARGLLERGGVVTT